MIPRLRQSCVLSAWAETLFREAVYSYKLCSGVEVFSAVLTSTEDLKLLLLSGLRPWKSWSEEHRWGVQEVSDGVSNVGYCEEDTYLHWHVGILRRAQASSQETNGRIWGISGAGYTSTAIRGRSSESFDWTERKYKEVYLFTCYSCGKDGHRSFILFPRSTWPQSETWQHLWNG